MYSVSNTLSEYIYFQYQKTLLHTLLLPIFKIVESLQCILKQKRGPLQDIKFLSCIKDE